MTRTFASLPLAPAMLANLDALDYREMTPIQAAVLPALLAGRDVIAQARTGSGKTVAFGLGLLARVDPSENATQALVLCPTRELADQVGKQLRRLARALPNLKLVVVCGGAPLYPQVATLRHGAHVVVGTPGRVAKHLRKGTLAADRVAVVVLDEGDRMLDMGFADEILAIFRLIQTNPGARQTLLFSATYPEGIERISAAIQRDPIRVSVDEAHAAHHIEQTFYPVEHGRGPALVAAWLKQHRPESTLVFCNTKAQCAALADALDRAGIHALALHGDLDQADRDRVLAMFANRSCPVLVATDVAARGLDIAELAAVINFELPRDPEIYVHRIGRTGRAGASGQAISLFTQGQLGWVRAIEAFQQAPAKLGDPSEVEAPADVRLDAPMVTLAIRGGRRDKLGAGDVLGALTSPGGVLGSQVGKITISDRWIWVAIERSVADQALAHLRREPIKKRHFDVRRL